MTRLRHLLVFLSYLACLVLLTWPVWRYFPHEQLAGIGSDGLLMMWMLKWWVYAFAHHLNPLFCPFVWYPFGVHLIATTNVPLLAFLTWPLTKISYFFSYQLLMMVSLPLSGYCCYLLCQYWLKHQAAAWSAGLIFAFSSYNITHFSLGHLNLVYSFFLPLFVYLILRAYRQTCRPFTYVLCLVALLVAQFFISKEYLLQYAVASIFFAMAGAYFCENRPRFWLLLRLSVYAFVIALLILSPFIISYLAHGGVVFHAAQAFSADAANYFLPTKVTWFGGALMDRLGLIFWAPFNESTAYLGLPLLIIGIFTVIRHWPCTSMRLIATLFVIFFIFSLGPIAHFLGYALFSFPWRTLYSLPLFLSLLPARLTLVTTLLTVLCLAFFLSRHTYPRWLRLLGLALVILSLAPKVSYLYQPWRQSNFLPDPILQQLIPKKANVLVLNANYALFLSRLMLRQLDSGQDFNLVNAYLGPGAIPYLSGLAFSFPNFFKISSVKLGGWLRHYPVDVIIVADAQRADFSALRGFPARCVRYDDMFFIYPWQSDDAFDIMHVTHCSLLSS